MKQNFPERKNIRWKGYDYDRGGAFFLTICIKDKQPILSQITKDDSAVGDGAPDVPKITLSPIGRIVEKYILSTNNIAKVRVDRYVIMPDHIHMILFVQALEDGTSRAPSPTNKRLPRIVAAFKRLCNAEIGQNIFQRSYIDHVIRDQDDYETRVKYICENPAHWYFKKTTGH